MRWLLYFTPCLLHFHPFWLNFLTHCFRIQEGSFNLNSSPVSPSHLHSHSVNLTSESPPLQLSPCQQYWRYTISYIDLLSVQRGVQGLDASTDQCQGNWIRGAIPWLLGKNLMTKYLSVNSLQRGSSTSSSTSFVFFFKLV